MRWFFAFVFFFFLISCKSNFLSDAHFMSAMEARATELEIIANGYQCQDISGKMGSCTLNLREGDSFRVQIRNIPPKESEIYFSSNCGFEGSRRIAKGEYEETFSPIPFKDETCTFAFTAIDTDKDEINEEPGGMIGIVTLIVRKKEYLALPSPEIVVIGNKLKVKASRFSKYLRLSSNNERIVLDKIDELTVPNKPLVIESWSELSRFSNAIHQ